MKISVLIFGFKINIRVIRKKSFFGGQSADVGRVEVKER